MNAPRTLPPMESLAAAPGLIFDFDGVILHSEPAHLEAWRESAAHHGVPLPGDFARLSVGRKDRLIAQDLERLCEGRISGQTLLDRKCASYERIAAGDPVLIEGVIEALPRLAAHYPLAIATSSYRQPVEELLREIGLFHYFRAICTAEEVRQVKPAPDIYLLAAERLGRAPAQCVAFEDSPIGMAAARAAGIPVIGVASSFEPDLLAAAEWVIGDFRELPAVLDWLAQWSPPRA